MDMDMTGKEDGEFGDKQKSMVNLGREGKKTLGPQKKKMTNFLGFQLKMSSANHKSGMIAHEHTHSNTQSVDLSEDDEAFLENMSNNSEN